MYRHGLTILHALMLVKSSIRFVCDRVYRDQVRSAGMPDGAWRWLKGAGPSSHSRVANQMSASVIATLKYISRSSRESVGGLIDCGTTERISRGFMDWLSVR